MQAYLDNLQLVLETGQVRKDRTGVGTISVFSPPEERYDLSDNKIPLVTTKRLHLKSIIHELIWMISGSTNVEYLIRNGVTIWNEWVIPGTEVWGEELSNVVLCADLEREFQRKYTNVSRESLLNQWEQVFGRPARKLVAGELGPVYGQQWRNIRDWVEVEPNQSLPPEYIEVSQDLRYRRIDQLSLLIRDLQDNPFSRRHILSAWHVPDIDRMALPPCHLLTQFYVSESEDGVRTLSSKLYMRSSDMFLGRPFNIAFYSILTQLLAKQLGYEAGEFVLSTGDAHIYMNHLTQVREQLSREPRHVSPRIKFLKRIKSILEFEYDDIEIIDYYPHAAIKAPVAV